jgi:predicted ATPase
MSHLKKITFDNFRVFENKTSLDIHPLTFLTGPNSSGKSSVLKALLLLKSNYNSDLQVLDFSGPKHNLGTFENTVNKKGSEKEIMTFGFQTSISNTGGVNSSFIKEPKTTKRSVYHILKEFDSEVYNDLNIELTYQKNERSGKLSSIEVFINNENESFLRLDIGNIDEAFHKIKFDLDKITKNTELKGLFFDNFFKITKKLPRKIQNYKFPTSFALQENSKSQYFDEPITVFSKL